MSLLSIYEVPGLYVDAVLTESDSLYSPLVFLSLWGRDTAIQEFLARLSLPPSQNGIQQFRVVESGAVKSTATVTDVDGYCKTTARMPKDNMFGEVVNLWLFKQLIEQPDTALRRGIALCLPDEDAETRFNKAWELVKTVCHLPMLEHWRDDVLDVFQSRGWIRYLNGHNVCAVNVAIADDVDDVVSQLIRERRLSIDAAA